MNQTARITTIPEHQSAFEKFDLKSIEVSDNTIYGLDREMRIVLANPAYYRFAQENNGPKVASDFGPGSILLDAITGPVRQFYEEFFASAFDSEEPLQHEYECSSPDLFRKFRLVAYPTPYRDGLLCEHSLIVEAPHAADVNSGSLQDYIDESGLMHQCGHCRRVRNLDGKRWDWVPASFDYAQVSHGLCNSCMGHYFPDLVD